MANAKGYGPVNPAILQGFEPDLAPTQTSRAPRLWHGERLGEQRTSPTQSTAGASFRYQLPDPAILDGFDENEEPVVPARPNGARKRPPKDSSGSGTPAEVSKPAASHPYESAIEARERDMTVSFLKGGTSAFQVDLPAYPMDEYGMGLRYERRTSDSSEVVITNQRVPAEVVGADSECTVCASTKPMAEFPGAAITATCKHAPTTCLECISTSIRTDLNSRLWNQIRCPECREPLQYADVQRYADAETRERYQTLSFRYAVSEADNFVWCTAGCGYGQVHDGGIDQPIVTCLLCNHRTCFHHDVAWHENLSCDEYDELQKDPLNFRSRFERDNEEADRAADARRAQEDADRVFAQSLDAQEHRMQQEREQEQERRKAEAAREAAQREERRSEAARARQDAARRKQEEQQSQATVAKTTKPCPGCGWAIEKNKGCSHMTCVKCRYQFCWSCNAKWDRVHPNYCAG